MEELIEDPAIEVWDQVWILCAFKAIDHPFTALFIAKRWPSVSGGRLLSKAASKIDGKLHCQVFHMLLVSILLCLCSIVLFLLGRVAWLLLLLLLAGVVAKCIHGNLSDHASDYYLSDVGHLIAFESERNWITHWRDLDHDICSFLFQYNMWLRENKSIIFYFTLWYLILHTCYRTVVLQAYQAR